MSRKRKTGLSAAPVGGREGCYVRLATQVQARTQQRTAATGR
ncbi:MAG: hypothetical protein AB7Q04_02025 [Steroidobacteraceae bacterium]